MVEFNIYGVFYKRETNEQGIARLNINLRPGDYIITAYHPDVDQKISNNIKVISSISGENITKYYKNGTQYYAKFLDINGNPLKNKMVDFNIYGVFYKRETNDQGIAKLNINLLPGEYIITAKNPVNNETYSNIIKVLPRLKGQNLIMNYKDGSKFKVKLVDNIGKPINKVNITMNIYGVFYIRTTNDQGIAELNINLMPGEYIITSYYEDLATSNKITVL